MYILKYWCDFFKNGFGLKNRSMSYGIESMVCEDCDMIGLFYWFVIMFDMVVVFMYE